MSVSLAVLLVSMVEMGPAAQPPAPRVVMVAQSVEEPELVFTRVVSTPIDSASAGGSLLGTVDLPLGHGPYRVFLTPATDDDTEQAGELEPPVTFAAEPNGCPLAASLEPLGRWLAVLLALGLVATILGSVGAARRPLPIAASAVRQPARPISLVERLLVLVCLWSPLLMLLGLMQAQHGLLSTVLLASAGVGAGACAMMMSARRRLLARLRWALGGRMDRLPDGTPISCEVDAKRLVAPPGLRGAVPWYRADLTVVVPGGGDTISTAARVALDDALVDEAAARALLRVALGKPAGTTLTVLGQAHRAPADACSALALDRYAPTQTRIGSTRAARAIVVAGSPAELARRLRHEGLLLGGALAASVGAALLTMLS
ncbi:MAG TPA: hypothetical protein VFF06_34980 [Polyangia bacterium]|nr:hypothetical protein [Polyangia bacterium]